MKKAWISAIVILTVITLFVLNCPFNITKTFNALEISVSDNKYAINRQLTFTGQYHINIFGPDVFSGKIVVSDYEQTSNGDKMYDCEITQKDLGSLIIFEKRDSNNTLEEANVFGTIYSKPFLKNVVIIVGEGYSNKNAICIVANVDNRNDAMYQVSKILDIEQ